MSIIKINISKDFTPTPGGRYIKDGPFSGEEFREKFLEKFFNDRNFKGEIEIILDGTYGYATSFLEETFGGLSRKYGKDIVKSKIKLISNDEPSLITEISNYIEGKHKR